MSELQLESSALDLAEQHIEDRDKVAESPVAQCVLSNQDILYLYQALSFRY